MKVLNEYPTHHYIENYEHETKMFCPNCGKQTVWSELLDGDYYTGATHLCVFCNVEFTIQGPTEATEQHKRIVVQIKSGVKGQPKTPRGR